MTIPDRLSTALADRYHMERELGAGGVAMVLPNGIWFALARRGGANHIVVLQNVPELERRAHGAGNVP